MRTLIATPITLMLFATTPVAAGDFEDGQAAYRAGDYQKAVRLWKPLAEQGDANTQNLSWPIFFGRILHKWQITAPNR